ncbi:MAG TPA: 6,7-dimethyl-8-ribityllumazine synthase [Stellaceae bacterium]|nr:6,7-dimethyl-8-ribityllumazine synthase [Stellaceae bacterium]
MPRALHIMIVEAPYYAHVSDQLAKGAVAALQEAGATYQRVAVPGAFEIPAAIRFAATAASRGLGPRFDGYVALGCVIRGETTHYQHVCQESARGLQDLAVRDELAIGFGILTVENEAQAMARAQVDKRNKGGEAARACLAMIALKRSFGLGPP